MRIERKEGLKKIEIKHNKTLLWIILLLVVILAAVIIAIVRAPKTPSDIPEALLCETDSDCIPSGCCHPTGCVNKNYPPKCAGMFCTEVCEPGTLDCGQGSCKCINSECKAVIG